MRAQHRTIVSTIPFIVAALLLAGCDQTSRAANPSIHDLPVLAGSEQCAWGGEGRNAICRRMIGFHTTTALEYPLLLQELGWRRPAVEREFPPLIDGGIHNGAIWLERPQENGCVELISLELFPAAPLSENTNPTMLIQTDYAPICDSNRVVE